MYPHFLVDTRIANFNDIQFKFNRDNKHLFIAFHNIHSFMRLNYFEKVSHFFRNCFHFPNKFCYFLWNEKRPPMHFLFSTGKRWLNLDCQGECPTYLTHDLSKNLRVRAANSTVSLSMWTNFSQTSFQSFFDLLKHLITVNKS